MMVNFSVSKQHEHWYDDVLLLHMVRANAEMYFGILVSRKFSAAEWNKLLSFINVLALSLLLFMLPADDHFIYLWIIEFK